MSKALPEPEAADRPVPGASIASRLFARGSTRASVGARAEFFHRLGIDDPYAVGDEEAGSQGPFTYLSSAAYFRDLRRSRFGLLGRITGQRMMERITAARSQRFGPAASTVRPSALARFALADEHFELLQEATPEAPEPIVIREARRPERRAAARRAPVARPVERAMARDGGQANDDLTRLLEQALQGLRGQERQRIRSVLEQAVVEEPSVRVRTITRAVRQLRGPSRAALQADVAELRDEGVAPMQAATSRSAVRQGKRGLRRGMSSSPSVMVLERHDERVAEDAVARVTTARRAPAARANVVKTARRSPRDTRTLPKAQPLVGRVEGQAPSRPVASTDVPRVVGPMASPPRARARTRLVSGPEPETFEADEVDPRVSQASPSSVVRRPTERIAAQVIEADEAYDTDRGLTARRRVDVSSDEMATSSPAEHLARVARRADAGAPTATSRAPVSSAASTYMAPKRRSKVIAPAQVFAEAPTDSSEVLADERPVAAAPRRLKNPTAQVPGARTDREAASGPPALTQPSRDGRARPAAEATVARAERRQRASTQRPTSFLTDDAREGVLAEEQVSPARRRPRVQPTLAAIEALGEPISALDDRRSIFPVQRRRPVTNASPVAPNWVRPSPVIASVSRQPVADEAPPEAVPAAARAARRLESVVTSSEGEGRPWAAARLAVGLSAVRRIRSVGPEQLLVAAAPVGDQPAASAVASRPVASRRGVATDATPGSRVAARPAPPRAEGVPAPDRSTNAERPMGRVLARRAVESDDAIAPSPVSYVLKRSTPALAPPTLEGAPDALEPVASPRAARRSTSAAQPFVDSRQGQEQVEGRRSAVQTVRPSKTLPPSALTTVRPSVESEEGSSASLSTPPQRRRPSVRASQRGEAQVRVDDRGRAVLAPAPIARRRARRASVEPVRASSSAALVARGAVPAQQQTVAPRPVQAFAWSMLIPQWVDALREDGVTLPAAVRRAVAEASPAVPPTTRRDRRDAPAMSMASPVDVDAEEPLALLEVAQRTRKAVQALGRLDQSVLSFDASKRTFGDVRGRPATVEARVEVGADGVVKRLVARRLATGEQVYLTPQEAEVVMGDTSPVRTAGRRLAPGAWAEERAAVGRADRSQVAAADREAPGVRLVERSAITDVGARRSIIRSPAVPTVLAQRTQGEASATEMGDSRLAARSRVAGVAVATARATPSDATSWAAAVPGTDVKRRAPLGLVAGLGSMTLAAAAMPSASLAAVVSDRGGRPLSPVEGRRAAVRSTVDAAEATPGVRRNRVRPALGQTMSTLSSDAEVAAEPRSTARTVRSVDPMVLAESGVGEPAASDASSPGWAKRATSPSPMFRDIPKAFLRPRLRTGGGLLTALARAGDAEDVVRVILERSADLGEAHALAPAAQRLLHCVADEAGQVAAAARGETTVRSATPLASSNVTLIRPSPQSTTTPPSARLGTRSSATTTQGVGASKVMKLANKLMKLIHLAESDGRSDAHKQVRMADTPSDARSEGGAGSNSGEEFDEKTMNIKALRQDVLDAVLRALEDMRWRREDPDGPSIWC
jgi:hypothetical protein